MLAVSRSRTTFPRRFTGIIHGTTEDSSCRYGRMALVICLSRNEFIVNPFLRHTRRIWVVTNSSKTCQATATGGCLLVLLMTDPRSNGPHLTRRRGFINFGNARRRHLHEGLAGCLSCGRRGISAPRRRRISAKAPMPSKSMWRMNTHSGSSASGEMRPYLMPIYSPSSSHSLNHAVMGSLAGISHYILRMCDSTVKHTYRFLRRSFHACLERLECQLEFIGRREVYGIVKSLVSAVCQRV